MPDVLISVEADVLDLIRARALPGESWSETFRRVFSAGRDEAARTKTIATRDRADTIRQSLEGRQHSDSAELVAEDRLR